MPKKLTKRLTKADYASHISRGAKARSRARSELPLEVAMAQKAVHTRRRGLMQKALSPNKGRPSKHTAKGRMIHKSRHKKAWYKATGQGNYGGYDKWGKSQ